MTEAYEPLSPAEEKQALELVEDIQAERGTNRLKLKDVPNVLLPYQARWHADKAAIRIGEKSRRVGFTWGCHGAEAPLEASIKGPAGMDQFYMGYNMAMAAEFIGDAAFFAKAYQLVASQMEAFRQIILIEDEKTDIITYRIRLANGRKIEALSSAPHNWRGRQGHARVDEAGHHKDLAAVIDAAMAFKLWGGRISITGTHNTEESQFNAYIKEIRAGNLPWSLHRCDFDQALAEGFYKRVCLVKGLEWSAEAEAKYRADAWASYPDKEAADEELGAIPRKGSGIYFPRLLVENAGIDGVPVLRFAKKDAFFTDPNREKITQDWLDEQVAPFLVQLDPELRTVAGQDFGRDNDLSVIKIAQRHTPLVWRIAFRIELRNIPFDMQELIGFYIFDRLPKFRHAKFDARGNGQSLAEKMAQKYTTQRIDCVKATTAHYDEAMPKYRAALEGRTFLIEKDEDSIQDHRSLVRVSGHCAVSGAKNKGIADGKNRHGDSAIASLNCYLATLEEGEPGAGATSENKSKPSNRRGQGQDQIIKRPSGLRFLGMFHRR
ncbi:hypothetical protein [Kordiimonas marina]|uniref:hypothetical protein n=1 Tax=Kordiimonas marina TaxID=2872312 RepID=UPI001FF28626|nr:hypothetical protein [Kordiimonas marina]MCJ9428556.1 hypothetical protein [Kordiimonas marina]